MGEADPMELVYSLRGFPAETEWIEFKVNSDDPERFGQDISALANAAAYHRRDCAYKVWGVDDTIHELVGTTFNPYKKKAKGNQDLLIWISRMLSSNANYEFQTATDGEHEFLVLTVKAAIGQPVTFDKAPYIREGSSTTRLQPGSSKERELWQRLGAVRFEAQDAERDVLLEELPDYLDIEAFFSLMDLRRPSELERAVRTLIEQGLVHAQDNGRYAVTNLGALLVGTRLSAFAGLRKRALRVISYDGAGNFGILDDQVFDKGYALALPEAERHIMSTVPSTEVVDGAFRRVRKEYPQQAVREMLSNAVIHQDLSDTTAGPLVGIYSNRIEFSNPGTTLIPVDRVLNAPPKSRNGDLAAILRQMDLCEEGGTGWDIAVAACESQHMLAPKMESDERLGTKVTLYAGSAYDRMKKAERKEAVYWHACLMYAQGESMGNQSLRERFGLDDSKKSMVAISRLIKECCDAGEIKEEDEESGARYRRYVPSWA